MKSSQTHREEEIKVLFPNIETALDAVRQVATFSKTLYIRDAIFGVPNNAKARKLRLRITDDFSRRTVEVVCKYRTGIENDVTCETEEMLYSGTSFDEALERIASYETGTYKEENAYEKIRILFTTSNNTEITLDIYPFGILVEIEGSPQDIHTTAAKLGFSPPDYIHDTADDLYLAWIQKHGLPEQWDVRFGLTGLR